ncbi:hypothetical protein M8J75_013923 [Diaphorina citri]|nr:hypothetical protein M8J75_013923 [Diaphorina citri]
MKCDRMCSKSSLVEQTLTLQRHKRGDNYIVNMVLDVGSCTSTDIVEEILEVHTLRIRAFENHCRSPSKLSILGLPELKRSGGKSQIKFT